MNGWLTILWPWQLAQFGLRCRKGALEAMAAAAALKLYRFIGRKIKLYYAVVINNIACRFILENPTVKVTCNRGIPCCILCG